MVLFEGAGVSNLLADSVAQSLCHCQNAHFHAPKRQHNHSHFHTVRSSCQPPIKSKLGILLVDTIRPMVDRVI